MASTGHKTHLLTIIGMWKTSQGMTVGEARAYIKELRKRPLVEIQAEYKEEEAAASIRNAKAKSPSVAPGIPKAFNFKRKDTTLTLQAWARAAIEKALGVAIETGALHREHGTALLETVMRAKTITLTTERGA